MTKLMIVESPNKVKTISQFVDKNTIVKASVGHVVKIADSGLYRMGINPETFDADFIIEPGKKDIVKELKTLVGKSDEIILATDDDREGEAIAYHLKEVLKIPAKKLKRCTFHEITKKAVTDALAHPRKIDQHLVDAALGRAKLDKIVGYRLSPISRRKVGARSVGRCQSVALKIVVEREEEITNFKPKTYYEIWLPFTKDKIEYKAQYKGLTTAKKVTTTLDKKEDAEKVLKDCKGKPYIVHSIESKDRQVSPKPPFITSTFQQEVSSKLGYPVKKAMECAQRLFEGINIGGVHKGLVTYLRTDSTSMDPEFQETLKGYVIKNYGKQYYEGLRTTKKAKNAQDGHECFRVIDLEMTPEKLSSYINDSQLLKVYTLIYNRTLASVMTNAIITDTDFIIVNGKHKFVYTEHAVKFDGFRKIYAYDEEELNKGLDLFTKETIENKDLILNEKSTQPPKRFSEATLVKKLEDLGIGRPSTYASIISILLDPGRGYCEEQGKAIAPTEKGITLSHFLDEAFPEIINYNYSAKLEEQLDEIAKGKVKEIDFLKKFYSELETMIKNTKTITITKPDKEFVEDHVCPECGNKLVIRQGRFGKFIGCNNYPRCKYTEKIK